MPCLLSKVFLDLPLFQEFEIVSGEKGLSNKISSVNIMDNPDAIDWFSVGEVLLTSGFFFADSEELQNKIMHQLKEINCPALCIKPQRYLGSIPKNMIKLSNELDLPIIELPYGFSFSKIMTRVNEKLTQEYDLLNRKSVDIAALFFDLSLHGGGLKDIGKTLADLTKSTVMMSDENWNILHTEVLNDGEGNNHLLNQPEQFLMEIVDSLPYKSHQFQKPISRFYEKDKISAHFIFMPVFFHKKHYGYIIVCNAENILDVSTAITFEQAAMAFALEQVKNDEIIRARNRVRRDFIEELITARIPSKAVLKTLAEEHHVDLSLAYVAVIFDFEFNGTHSIDDSSLRNYAENTLMKKILNYLDQYKRVYNESSLYFNSRDKIIFLFGLKEDTGTEGIRETIREKANQIEKNFPEITIRAGIGQKVDHLFDIPTSYQEAEETVKLMDPASDLVVSHYDDFLVQHLLLTHLPKENMQVFSDKILGELLSPSNNYPVEFLESLESLIDHQMNLAETARSLFIHRNTLLYRKEKLEEILQVDFKNHEDVLKIDIALRFHHYLTQQ